MNCFAYPGALPSIAKHLALSLPTEEPEFGFAPHVALRDGTSDATEVDMRIGSFLFEAKLSEADFTARDEQHVQRYRDLDRIFEVSALPRHGSEMRGYQLIRNVLAAAQLEATLVVLVDGRRPDLLQEWWEVHGAIRDSLLRKRCHFRTWQQVASAAPADLQKFLNAKYGL
jgi:hypothetical protein